MIFESWALALGIGGGLFFGLNALGREIRVGLVEAAKVKNGQDIATPNPNI